ncbi:hypothetical protein [Antrihabitans sp. YC2-6]|jgi:hypothetical protein|uniref:RskA family anti-sigma factor n=1 Tax=Antrihabitans sp. YC2-6 TaxID=2799498 RepID=UPI0018F32BF5|nr:hypothetical protein [Antrihabitans sp. YC2-6]MBJ8348951.1 hypothetical protein [Antrihabitans sp. YC2-6]
MSDLSQVRPFDDGRDLIALAYPYALDAIGDSERDQIARRLAFVDDEVRRAFAKVVDDVHDIMALLAIAGATAPPPRLRRTILDALDPPPRMTDLR